MAVRLYFTFLILFFSLLLFSCANEEQTRSDFLIEENFEEEELTSIIEVIEIDTLEERLIAAGLIGIQSIDNRIMIDLKYTTTDNFMGINLYGNVSDAYLQPEIAKRLSNVQSHLSKIDSNLVLYVFDAVRPLSVQQKMWDALDSIPVNERVKFVSNPKNGSIHNYAAAVDLSIYNLLKDTLLDMGAGFDDLRKIAYPKFESHFLEKGELTLEQLNNRKLLRKVMRKEGFHVLETEWWHFNACSRESAKKFYELIH